MQRSGAHNKLGSLGENLAADFLIDKGYEILERNLDLNVGEIDLLCQKDDVLVVVEVKTVTKASAIDPVYKINPLKRKKLHLLCQIIAAKVPEQNIQCDGVIIVMNEQPTITHLQNIV